uniref:G-protein coupled receptors family 2 profile 2 domain-containing protein n=1 Tax=Cyprinus carpio TaxID=7962 RepID=A0A8C2FJT7_CYPCA
MSRAKMMVIAFIVGHGAPLLVVVITVASTAGPQNYISKRNACWLNWNETKALLAFVIQAFTIVAINLVVLIVVLYKMMRRGVGAEIQPDEKHALVVIARCVAILTPIFGLTWGFGIGSMVSCDFGIHVVFALLNSLQVLFNNFIVILYISEITLYRFISTVLLITWLLSNIIKDCSEILSDSFNVMSPGQCAQVYQGFPKVMTPFTCRVYVFGSCYRFPEQSWFRLYCFGREVRGR